MAQRAEPPDSLDLFCTPPWATRALCEHVIDIRGKQVWEPACGLGHMVRPLREYASGCLASDVHDYRWGHLLHDFLMPFAPIEARGIRWTVVNPPFRLAQEFILRGLHVSELGVAVLVRTVFTEGGERYRELFKPRPPSIAAQFVERVPMLKGRLDQHASSATAYMWLVWYREPAWSGCKLQWIPPCRKQLERTEDYYEPGAKS